VLDLIRPNRGIQGGGELPHRANGRGIGIHRAHIEAVPQEEHEIASAAAAGVENAPATIEPAAKELVEEIDIHLAELTSDFGGQVGGHETIILLVDSCS
jgi:hypothetical protein